MPFPSQYKKALLDGSKNTTIRTSEEVGKYVPGKIYAAKSYEGESLGVRIKVLKVISTSLDELNNFGIPAKDVEVVRDGVSEPNGLVELIRFELL